MADTSPQHTPGAFGQQGTFGPQQAGEPYPPPGSAGSAVVGAPYLQHGYEDQPGYPQAVCRQVEYRRLDSYQGPRRDQASSAYSQGDH